MKSQILTKPWPYIALILAHIIWGANFVVAKITLQEFPPMTLALLRFAFASLLLAPFFIIENRKIKISVKDLPRLITAGVFIISLNIAFFFEGIKRTTAIEASVLTLIIPVISVLLGWWFLKEKVFLINLAGVTIALIGTLVVIGLPKILTGSLNTQNMLGNILIVLASVSWVIGAVVSKGLLTKYSSLVVTAMAFMIGTITMFVPASLEYLQNPGWVDKITVLGFLGLGYITLLSSVSAYFLFEWGLSRTTVISADLLQYLEPFVAVFFAVTILGEGFSKSFAIGAVLIAVGVFLGTMAKENYHRQKRSHRL